MVAVKKLMSSALNTHMARDKKIAAAIYIQQYAEISLAGDEERKPEALFSAEVAATALATLRASRNPMLPIEEWPYLNAVPKAVPFYKEFAFINIPDKGLDTNNKRYILLAATENGLLEEYYAHDEKIPLVGVNFPPDVTIGTGDLKVAIRHSDFGDMPKSFCKHLRDLYGINVAKVPSVLTAPENEIDDAANALVKGIVAADAQQLLNSDIVKGLFELAKVEKAVAKALEFQRVTLTEKDGSIAMVIVRHETTSVY